MVKVGVYVCHCGTNIAGVVDVEAVRAFAETLPGVALARRSLFMCSDTGQEMIKQDIRDGLVDRVVVAACTPRTHEPIFRAACEAAGMNKYLFEMANIRDQDSWVHGQDHAGATEKAKKIVASAVAKASNLKPLEDKYVDVEPTALVIGGGVAGIFSALELGGMGYKTYLVEKEPSIGGVMAQLDKTFPTNDCSACILTPVMVDAGNHPNIELLTYSEVESVEGYIGNFTVKVRKSRPISIGTNARVAEPVPRFVRPRCQIPLIAVSMNAVLPIFIFPRPFPRKRSLIWNTASIVQDARSAPSPRSAKKRASPCMPRAKRPVRPMPSIAPCPWILKGSFWS
jgi:heterodisulfide reductase subunit A-like polyferredoxin